MGASKRLRGIAPPATGVVLAEFCGHRKQKLANKIDEADVNDPLKQAKAKAAATYDAAADHFDDEPLTFWKRIGRHTVIHLGLPAGANVLDVGCGTGASALPAAQAVGPNGRVLGVDLSAPLLEQARTKATAYDLKNVEFRLADMTALGFPDGHFDAVISVFSIFFVPDMEGLVRELWRMVRPGRKTSRDHMGSADFRARLFALARGSTARTSGSP